MAAVVMRQSSSSEGGAAVNAPPSVECNSVSAPTAEASFRIRSTASRDTTAFKPIEPDLTTPSPHKPVKSNFGQAFTTLRKSLTVRRNPTSSKSASCKSNKSELPRSKSYEHSSPESKGAGGALGKTFQAFWKPKKKEVKDVADDQKPTPTKLTDHRHRPETANMTTKPPSIHFVQPNKYFIENFNDAPQIIQFGQEEDAGMKHAIMIHNCNNSTINISRKVNKIEIDHCKKLTVTVPAVVSSIDIQHSHSSAVHVTQRLPGASIDSCSSLSIHIPRESMAEFSVSSAGGGSADIIVPKEDDPEDHDEYPVPFQFVHTFKDNKLVSEVSPLYTS